MLYFQLNIYFIILIAAVKYILYIQHMLFFCVFQGGQSEQQHGAVDDQVARDDNQPHQREQDKQPDGEDEEMGLMKRFFNQTRKPEGFLGKLMLGSMNSGHAKLADWGFEHLPELDVSRAADLGCGAGRNAGELVRRFTKAHVTAVDYSELSVEKATAYNRASIQAGRCTVQQGDVSALMLPANTFDLAIAFETVYFWPGLERCFAQVAGILKPGGVFMICNESDGTDPASLKFEKIIEGMKNYTAEEIGAARRLSAEAAAAVIFC